MSREREASLLSSTCGWVERVSDVLPRELDLNHTLNLRQDGVVRDTLSLLILINNLRLASDFLHVRSSSQSKLSITEHWANIR